MTKTKHYLSLKEVAARLGVVPGTLTRLPLPEPDVMIGTTRGWTPEAIDRWNAARPGRGNWKGKVTEGTRP
jgi:hypothetical protein